MIPYLLAVAGGFLIGASQIKDSFEEGGEIFAEGDGIGSKYDWVKSYLEDLDEDSVRITLEGVWGSSDELDTWSKRKMIAQAMKNNNEEIDYIYTNFYGYAKGGVVKEKLYIDYLNKKKKFSRDRKYFNSYEDAKKWGLKNLGNFNPDMIKYEYDKGGGIGSKNDWVENETILKQNDDIYFTFVKPLNKIKDANIIRIYDFADAEDIENGDTMDLPLPIKNVDYALVKKKWHENLRWSLFNDVIGKKINKYKNEKFRLTLEEILDDVFVFKGETDFSEHYVIIPKNEIIIDWEETLKSIDTTAYNTRKRKKDIKEGKFKFARGHYGGYNKFIYSKYAKGGGIEKFEERFSEYSNDALYDMIINLSRFENNEELIQSVKDELKRRNETKKVSIKYKGNDYYFDADLDEGDLEDIDIRPAYKLDHPFFQAIENEFLDYLDNLAPRDTKEMYEEEYLIKKEAIREGISAISDYMIQNNIKELDLDKDWNKIDIEGIWQG